MEERVKKVLDDKEIKYSYKVLGEPNEEIQFSTFYIDINISNDEDAPKYTELIIWLPLNAKSQFINYYVPKVIEIPKGSESKVKNFLLDCNAKSTFGSFGIFKRSRDVTFTFAELASYSKSGQDVFEIRKIPSYIDAIQVRLSTALPEIKELFQANKESDK